MDGSRFDALAKAFTQGAIRRGILRTALGWNLAGILALGNVSSAAKKRRNSAGNKENARERHRRAESEKKGKKKPKKKTLCHQGTTIKVSKKAVKKHLAHGDTLGDCLPSPGEPLCPTCGTCEACRATGSDDTATCGLPCADPCAAEILCRQAEQDEAYRRLARHLLEEGYARSGTPTASEASQDGMAASALSTDFISTSDPRRIAVLIYALTSAGERVAYVIVYQDGNALYGLTVDGGEITQVLPPTEATTATAGARVLPVSLTPQAGAGGDGCSLCSRVCEVAETFGCSNGNASLPAMACGGAGPFGIVLCTLTLIVVCKRLGQLGGCEGVCSPFCQPCDGLCGPCEKCIEETGICEFQCRCPEGFAFCDSECCTNKCQYCSVELGGVCVPDLGICDECFECNPVDGSCEPHVCSDPCHSCSNSSCVPDDGAGGCGECQECSGGICVPCPAGSECCGGTCRVNCPGSSVRDPNTCQCACSLEVCSTGETVNTEKCRCECLPDYKRCNDACIPDGDCCSNDDCSGGKTCQNGRCACTGEKQDCGGTCCTNCCEGNVCCDPLTCCEGQCCAAEACCHLTGVCCSGGEKCCDQTTCVPEDGCCGNSDCGECSECVGNTCQPIQCGACQVCSGGACVSCPTGTSCCNGTCVANCPAGSVRNTSTCQCVVGVCGSPTQSCGAPTGARCSANNPNCICRSGPSGTVCTDSNFSFCSGTATQPGCFSTGCAAGYRCVRVNTTCCPSGEACIARCTS